MTHTTFIKLDLRHERVKRKHREARNGFQIQRMFMLEQVLKEIKVVKKEIAKRVFLGV